MQSIDINKNSTLNELEWSNVIKVKVVIIYV